METDKIIELLKENLVETGIYIRAKKDGKYQSIDYINLFPSQVQDESRWGSDSWNKILGSIITHLGAALSPDDKMVTNQHCVMALLALLRKLGVEAKERQLIED